MEDETGEIAGTLEVIPDAPPLVEAAAEVAAPEVKDGVPRPFAQGLNAWEDEDWDKLLTAIAKGKVIPIVGRDLLIAPDGSGLTLHQYLGRSLVERLRVIRPNMAGLDVEVHSLNYAVGLCLKERNHKLSTYSDICYFLRRVLNEEVRNWAIPEPLKKLAEITDFQLYVTTTFDSLMQRALEEASGEARRFPDVRTFTASRDGNEVEDLPVAEPRTGKLAPGGRDAGKTFVYHLMGRLVEHTDSIVISDEDLLEFVCSLYSEIAERVPVNLLHRFSTSHLLLLGCSFSDWLTRFFVRAAKRSRISGRTGDTIEYVVDDYSDRDANLVVFVEQFWPNLRIFRTKDVCGFIDELHAQWRRRNPEPLPPPERPPVTLNEAPHNKKVYKGKVFLSYAHEDKLAAERVRERLKHLPVWFDKESLASGDEWARKIEYSIKKCRVFVPIISRNTQRRREGYFRREWRIAAQRKGHMDDDLKFILPVVIDDTKQINARMPEEFISNQWTYAPDGEISAEFFQAIEELLCDGLFEDEDVAADAANGTTNRELLS
jgi:hypothetical protein